MVIAKGYITIVALNDGKTYYTHFAYANSADGSSHFNTTYFSNALYIGVCSDTNNAAPTSYKSYTWSRLKGDTGATGATGASGYQIVMNPAQLVFDTDNNGIVTAASLAANIGKVLINRGGTDVTPASVSIDTNNNVHCTASVSGNTVTVKSVETDSGTRMSCGFGYVGITATLDGRTLTTKLPWAVNLHKVTASLKTNEEDITASVKSISTTVDNIQVGGRNLLKGTRLLTGSCFNGFIGSGSNVITNDYSSFTSISHSFTSSVLDMLGWNNVITPTPNTYYILSFYAKSTVEGDTIISHFYPNTEINPTDGLTLTTLTTKWTKYVVTWHTRSDISGVKSIIIARLTNGKGTGTVSVCGVKFEEGNKATDWTPAPEDTDNAINGVSDSVGKLTTRMTDAEAKITSDAINLTVKSQINKAVEDLQVGGRNLIPNSTFDNGLDSGWDYNSSYIVVKPDGYAGHGIVQYSGNSKAPSVHVNKHIPSSKLRPNTEYILSCCAWMSSANRSGLLGLFVEGNKSAGDNYSNLAGGTVGWTKYTLKFTTAATLSDTYNVGWFFGSTTAETGTVKVGMFQLEEGNKVTDWSPAPEDTDDAIDTVYSKIKSTGIDIEDGKIEAQADNFKIKNNAGEQTFAINENGDIEGKKGACFHGDFKSDGSAQFGACRIEGTGDNTHFGFTDDQGQSFKSIEVTRNATLPLSEMNQSSKDSGTVSITQGYLFASSTNGNNDSQVKTITYGTFTTKYDNDELTITGTLSAKADTAFSHPSKSSEISICLAYASIDVYVMDVSGNYICSPTNVSKQSSYEEDNGIDTSTLTRKVTLAKAGTYRIVGRLEVRALATGLSDASAEIHSNIAASWKYNPEETRTIFGADGWYNRTSNSQWVHLKGGILSLPPSCLQIVGEHSTMKGTGMLLAGSVEGNGGVNTYIGVAKDGIQRISQGIYIIYHTIGNVKYAALATWAGNDQRGYINVFDKTATSFKVSIRVYGNADDNVDHDFDFAVFGEM